MSIRSEYLIAVFVFFVLALAIYVSWTHPKETETNSWDARNLPNHTVPENITNYFANCTTNDKGEVWCEMI